MAHCRGVDGLQTTAAHFLSLDPPRPPPPPPPHHPPPRPPIHTPDTKAAINHGRSRAPSPDGITLAPEARALAEVYALMVYRHQDEAAEDRWPPQALAAWRAWYDTTPDTPC